MRQRLGGRVLVERCAHPTEESYIQAHARLIIASSHSVLLLDRIARDLTSPTCRAVADADAAKVAGFMLFFFKNELTKNQFDPCGPCLRGYSLTAL